MGDEYMVGNNEYVDAKYFDELLECMEEALYQQLWEADLKPDDNWPIRVSSLNLRALIDYCAVLRRVMDAVELGEVAQYQRGLSDGRKEGRAEVLEDLTRQLTEGHYHLYDYKEVAEILRLRWQGGVK